MFVPACGMLLPQNCVPTQAAAAAAQHSQELASLQAQLAALQQEKRQLFGKSAQQSRNARQAAAAAGELQGQLEQLRQQLARQSKQLEAKEAALARWAWTVHLRLCWVPELLAAVTS